jgi:hypothetical protein
MFYSAVVQIPIFLAITASVITNTRPQLKHRRKHKNHNIYKTAESEYSPGKKSVVLCD